MRPVSIIFGSMLAIIILVAAIWVWTAAPLASVELTPARADLAIWAIRSAAVSLAAAGQVLLLTIGLQSRDTFSDALRLTAVFVTVLAAITAAALGLAAR